MLFRSNDTATTEIYTLSLLDALPISTSRDRDQYFRVADVRDAAERLVIESQRSPAAVLFGAERTGLRNEDLEPAHVLIRIPANEAYLSLNLALSRFFSPHSAIKLFARLELDSLMKH